VGGTDPLALPAGRYARLSVRDDGLGMDAAIRARIFDPFFTTKPVGQGTGLGLAVVHGIVTSAGGAIEVDSTPGRGTTVAVWWPLVAATPQPTDAPLADAPAAAAPHHGVATPMGLPAPAPARGQRVLYVDDDAVVGMTVQALLQRAGYTVVCVDSGEQALQQLAADPHSADIVVTDFNMPGMSGLMLAQALQARSPGLPVVITSGYVTDDLQAAADNAGVRAVLYKEHTLERLATLVADVLAGRPVAAADADS
jgi:CheY-like chemotaxis protein